MYSEVITYVALLLLKYFDKYYWKFTRIETKQNVRVYCNTNATSARVL